MSVGLPATARGRRRRSAQGAIDKGEDPALVDRALALDAERRRLLGEADALKAERNAASKRIGEAIQGGADAGRAGGRRPARPPRPRPGTGSRAWTPTAGRVEASSRTCCCASRTRPTRTSRSAARRPTSRPDVGRVLPASSPPAARSVPTRRPVARPGRGSRTGRSPRRSTSSTSRAAPRSPAPASPSTGARARRSSAPSSTCSSTSTPASTA